MKEWAKKSRFLAILFAGMVFPCLAEVGVRPASQISNDTTDWMKKVADWQLTQGSWNSSVTWERGALFAGLMACYEATKDETYLNKSREFAVKFNWRLASDSHHADNNAVGQDYMELYFLDSQDPARYAHFKSVSDSHAAASVSTTTFNCNVSGGNETWWWCDALFMAPPGLVRLSRAVNDSSYTAFMHRMWGETQSCLYDTGEHLFFRDITYISQRYNGKKVFWSRGNGWVVAGTARVLQYLPLDDPNRPCYTTLLQEMSAKLAEIQQPDGYWYSDLLSPERYNNPESSGTGFFTYGIAWGINNGLLDETTYWPTVELGWEALKAAVQSNGLLGWVQPVGAGPTNTSAATTDVFGVGAYLLAGSEVLKYVWSHDPNSIEYFESYTSDAALQAAWADGDTNGTAGQVTLGDYGDNFMQLAYQNDQSPYRSQTDYTFATPKDFMLNERGYLSVLVRGNTSNAAEVMYVRLEDQTGNWAVQVMTDTTVAQTAGWMELAFRLSGFTGVDLTQVKKLSIGVGSPDASSATGSGTLRIDNIRLYPEKCVAVQEDFNGDCMVDMKDFAVIAGQWLEEYIETITPVDPGTTDLTAWWTFDESSGSSATDSSGNDYTGTLYNNASFQSTSGKYAGAVYINGISGGGGSSRSRVEIPISAISLDAFTVSMWINPGTNQTFAGTRYIFGHTTTTGGAWGSRIQLYMDNYDMGLDLGLGGSHALNTGIDTIPIGEWTHIALTLDGTNYHVYVNGLLEASGTYSNVTTLGYAQIGNDAGYSTTYSLSGSREAFNGLIDEVRIYNAVLSQANMLYLAEATAPISQITDPRPTDLALDGVINMDDLLVFIESWAQDTYWP